MYKILAILALILFSSLSYAQDVSNVYIRSIKGERINLEEYVQENKNVVVAVWQINCGPCIKEIPILRRLVSARRGWKLVLVTTDKDFKKVDDFLVKTKRGNWEVYFDSKGDMVRKFSIRSTPYTVVFRDRKIVKIYAGLFNEASIVQALGNEDK